MTDPDRLANLLAERRSGFSLPQPFYLAEDLYRADLDAVFATDWLFACNACEIPKPGDWITMEVGPDSVIVLRDRDGEVRAFHNTCRHRGSRLCPGEHGRNAVLVCPYHQWTYGLDGRLRGAPTMPKDFDRAAYGLKPARVELVCNMVYVSLSEDPPSLARFRETVTPYIAPHAPERTKVAFAMTILEEANWKLVIENNRECYHCSANHPELCATLVEFAMPDAPEAGAFQHLIDSSTRRWDALGLPHRPADGGDEFRCIRLPFHDGAVSFTADGRPASAKLMGDLTEPDLGSVRMFRAPNNWNHFLSDNIIHFRVLPLGPDRTALRTTWLVHEDAVEGVDYDVETLTSVWIATNDQDSRLAATNHRGIRSRAYEPGPYAPSEFMLTNFTDWYARKMASWLDGVPRGLRMAAE